MEVSGDHPPLQMGRRRRRGSWLRWLARVFVGFVVLDRTFMVMEASYSIMPLVLVAMAFGLGISMFEDNDDV